MSCLLALCASSTLQLAVAVHRGTFEPTAVMLLISAGILIVAALCGRGRVDVRWLLAPTLVVIVHGMLSWIPLPMAPHNPSMFATVPAVLAAISLTYLLPVSRLLGHVRFAVIAALALALAINAVQASPHPRIDVFDMQTQGADDLLQGRDPYATVSVTDTNDRSASVPYTYAPVTLLATTLARGALGDIRFAMIAALVLAGLAIRMALRRTDAPDLVRDAAALVLFGGPLTGFVIEEAWVDLVPLGLLCAAVWALSAERRTLAAVLFGLALAGKQPLVIGFPLMMLLPGIGRRELAIALATAAATVIPFFAWNPGAFWNGCVTYFAHLPNRSDALTLRNLIDVRFDHGPGEVFGAIAAVIAVAFAWRRVPRAAGSFLLLFSFALLCIFATGRLAFANYYFLLAGLAAAAAAMQYAPEPITTPQRST